MSIAHLLVISISAFIFSFYSSWAYGLDKDATYRVDGLQKPAEIIVDTDQHTIEACVDQIIAELESRGTFQKLETTDIASTG